MHQKSNEFYFSTNLTPQIPQILGVHYQNTDGDLEIVPQMGFGAIRLAANLVNIIRQLKYLVKVKGQQR
jgi:hypothetical protein